MVRVGNCAGSVECGGAWPGQVTQCRQQYLDHKLVVLTMEVSCTTHLTLADTAVLQGEVILDSFSFPSCCSCHVLNIGF